VKVKLIKDYMWSGNDCFYKKDDILEVEELLGFTQCYARYYQHMDGYETFDWIPKIICEVIS